MNFLYHLVPENMIGKILYPLNRLKSISPKSYKEQVKKYNKREHVLEKTILSLNCKWKDVIHLTAVIPSKITRALKEAGYNTQKSKWYKIPAKLLDPKKTTIYIYKFKRDLSQLTAPDQFTSFSIDKLSKYDKIPKRTIKYYEDELKKGRKPLRFHFIPHVFYKGELDISECEIIKT